MCLWVCYHDNSKLGLVVTISSWLNFGRPAPREGGLRRGGYFWLRLTTASAQCLRLSERFFHYMVINSFICSFVRSKNQCRRLETHCTWTGHARLNELIKLDERNIFTLSTTPPPALSEILLMRMLTRDLVAVANILARASPKFLWRPCDLTCRATKFGMWGGAFSSVSATPPAEGAEPPTTP